jgi:hypothetical protein
MLNPAIQIIKTIKTVLRIKAAFLPTKKGMKLSLPNGGTGIPDNNK